MKPLCLPLNRTLAAAALLGLGALSLPEAAYASPGLKAGSARTSASSFSRKPFIIKSHVPSSYLRPDARYPVVREPAPRTTPGSGYYRALSTGVSVQQALARRGYYHGGIDGLIGPYSQRAIVRYQNDHGLVPTGRVSSTLLRSLRLPQAAPPP